MKVKLLLLITAIHLSPLEQGLQGALPPACGKPLSANRKVLSVSLLTLNGVLFPFFALYYIIVVKIIIDLHFQAVKKDNQKAFNYHYDPEARQQHGQPYPLSCR